MIEDFTYRTFADRHGETFRLRVDDDHVYDLTLATVVDHADKDWNLPAEPDSRSPFSMIFVGRTNGVLPQRIYQLEHDSLGEFELFLVPVGMDANGVQYEAVFT